jgi:hypothetical protein
MLSFASKSNSVCDAWIEKLKVKARARINQALIAEGDKFAPATELDFCSYKYRVFDFQLDYREKESLSSSLLQYGMNVAFTDDVDVFKGKYTGFYLEAFEKEEDYKHWEKYVEGCAFEWLFRKLNAELLREAENSPERQFLYDFTIDLESIDGSEPIEFRKLIFARPFKWLDAITPYTAEISEFGNAIFISRKDWEKGLARSRDRLMAIVFSSLTIVNRKPAYSEALDLQEDKPDWHTLPQTAMKLVIQFLVGKVNV